MACEIKPLVISPEENLPCQHGLEYADFITSNRKLRLPHLLKGSPTNIFKHNYKQPIFPNQVNANKLNYKQPIFIPETK